MTPKQPAASGGKVPATRQRPVKTPAKRSSSAPSKAKSAKRPGRRHERLGLRKATTGRPLKVIARVHAYPPEHNAGAEWMLHTMLRALVERGHEVEVWLTRYATERATYELDGVRVVPFATRMDFGTAVRGCDVVVSHLENVQSAAALTRGFRKRLAVIAHNTFSQSFRDMCGGVHLAVFNSEWTKSKAEEHFATIDRARVPAPPAQSLVVRPPVVGDEYRTQPGDRVTLINLNAAKGGKLFWQLAERMPDTKFLAVKGAYGPQEVREGYPNVDVVEHVPGDRMAEEVYSRTGLLLMPSEYESWGRVGIEAMHSGIPVIAHPAPGLVESLSASGHFVDRRQPFEWQQTISKLLEPEEWMAASQLARDRAAELDPMPDLKAWVKAIEALPGSK